MRLTVMLMTLATGAGLCGHGGPLHMALPAFLTPEEAARVSRLGELELLFRGEHRAYFIDGRRTQHNFPAELIAGENKQRYVTANVAALAITKIADLLCLRPPLIRAAEADVGAQAAIDRIDRDSGFASVLHQACVNAGYQGEAWLQVFIRSDLGTPTGGAIIGLVPTEQVFPDASTRKPNGTYGRVVKQWVVDAPNTNGRIKLLRREVHTPGLVENELHQLNTAGAIVRRLTLDQHPETAGLPDAQPTAARMPLLQMTPNVMVGGRCVSDLDGGAASLIDQVNASATQIARVLAKHADPKMGIPEELYDEDGNLTSTRDAFPLRSKDQLPVYLVWNAQLESAFKMLDWSLRTLLILSEMSPSLLGIREGAAAEAWKKLRLEAAPTLAKVARRLLWLDRAVKDIYLTALEAEQTIPGVGYAVAEPDVTWREGLPIDEDTQAQSQAILKGAGLISLSAAVHERLGDPDQAEAEIEQIAAEKDAAAARLVVDAPTLTTPAAGGDEEDLA